MSKSTISTFQLSENFMSFCLGHSDNPTPSEVRWVWLCILVIIVLIANRAFGQQADNSRWPDAPVRPPVPKSLYLRS